MTIEPVANRVKRPRTNLEKADLADAVKMLQGDLRELAGKVAACVDFLFLEGSSSNDQPCFGEIERQLASRLLLVVDNVGIVASGRKKFLELVRFKYQRKTDWIDIDLP
jgi:predicted O-methyltransferase YrrM